MKILSFSAAALLALTATAHAADYNFIAGKDFQQFSRTPQGAGLGLSIDYLNSDHNGNAGGAGLEFAFPLGPVTLAAGGKLMGLNPSSGSGTAALLGGRANIQLAPRSASTARPITAATAWPAAASRMSATSPPACAGTRSARSPWKPATVISISSARIATATAAWRTACISAPVLPLNQHCATKTAPHCGAVLVAAHSARLASNTA